MDMYYVASLDTNVAIPRFMMGQYVTLHGEVISHVNISRTIVEDGGLYTCEATNRAGSSIHSARLNVYGEWRGMYLLNITGKLLEQ